MHEHDQDDRTDPVLAEPDPVDAVPGDESDPTEETDAELDGLAADLDTVESALRSLDADDLDQAETLAASLGGRDAGEPVVDAPAPDPHTPEA